MGGGFERVTTEPVSLLAVVASALGDLRSRVVFIGGAAAPLLHVDPPFAAPRPTTDVDAIVVTASYAEFNRVASELRSRGFREVQAAHAHKWVTPGAPAVEFDLVPAGHHLGASGNPWDIVAVETAVETTLEGGVTIRHVSAPGFLALKFGAFNDRGQQEAYYSSDLEDIFAVVAARPGLLEECAGSREDLKGFVAAEAQKLISREDFEDLQAGHLANVYRARAAAVIPMVEASLRRIASLG